MHDATLDMHPAARVADEALSRQQSPSPARQCRQ